MNRVFKLNNWVITFLFLSAIVVLNGCGAQGEAVNSSPSAMAWKNGVRGQWQLQSIDKLNFPSDYSVKTLFEEAPPECFIGSVWNLPFNGNGSITFTSEGVLCAPGAVRNIVWSIYNPGKNMGDPEFQFKKIYPGDRPSSVLTGYRLELSYADEESLTMVMPVNLGQGTGSLVFNFVKY